VSQTRTNVPIQLEERAGVRWKEQRIDFACSFPQGQLDIDEVGRLKLACAGRFSDLRTDVRATWPDGSARWVGLSAWVDLEPFEVRDCLLQVDGFMQQEVEAGNTPRIDDHRPCVFRPDHGFELRAEGEVIRLIRAETERSCRIVAIDSRGERFRTDVAAIYAPGDMAWEPYRFGLEGTLQSTSERLRFELWIAERFAPGTMELELHIHNPRKATHPGNIWDLGDPGSVLLHGFGLELSGAGETELRIQDESYAFSEGSGPVRITQYGSGGNAWDSPVHLDAQGELHPEQRGWEAFASGARLASGNRAQPALRRGDTALALPQFWQHFPCALETDDSQLTAWVLAPVSRPHELQGGERKTRKILVATGAASRELERLVALLPRVHVPKEALSAGEHLDACRESDRVAPIDELVRAPKAGPACWIEKREQIDEYGWRNFGDVFADHESLYQPAGAPPLVSHYNNQYDLIYGFLRQWLRTGEATWFELGDDLARHVVDIDIYATKEDRPEYCGGLFWHTDHYLPAATSTHRTHSRHNVPDGKSAAIGGGPGTEHCYTTGLLLHYWLTGSRRSADAVLTLANWMVEVHEPRDLIGTFVRLPRRELAALLARARGRIRPDAHYPLTRGTGNYLIALLDAYELTRDPAWIERAQMVVAKTFSALDDVDARDLLDVERRWSYTVFLIAIGRFLLLKRRLGEKDAFYHHARDALAHYARWMTEHEMCYLDSKRELDYPNATWIAQELRKTVVLLFAHGFSPVGTAPFSVKAHDFLEYSVRRLGSEPTSHFTRIQAILLQNDSVHDLRCLSAGQLDASPLGTTIAIAQPGTMALALRELGRALLRPLRDFSWHREWRVLRSRIFARART
jgi:hypothetical protein